MAIMPFPLVVTLVSSWLRRLGPLGTCVETITHSLVVITLCRMTCSSSNGLMPFLDSAMISGGLKSLGRTRIVVRFVVLVGLMISPSCLR